MKRVVVIAGVVAQLVVLGYMAGEREWVLRTGKSVFLRTAPIDPSDPMRGDYVRLSYELSTVGKRLCRDGVLRWFDPKTIYKKARDRRVYAAIKLDGEGVAELISLSDVAPSSGVFLRGRTDSVSLNSIQVRFGVEALFMQQGKARLFEATARGEKSGVPLNVEVAVRDDGLAVIRGHRWEPLGITLTLDRNVAVPTARGQSGAQARVPRPGLAGVTVQLKNHGAKPLAIVAGDDARFFRLVPSRDDSFGDGSAGWAGVRAEAPRAKPRPHEVKVLQPGQSYEVHLDFSRPEWFVQKRTDKEAPQPATSLSTLTDDWLASFRVEYAPPPAEECVGLPDAELIRQSPLRSRMFGPAGGVD
ncbi:MAG: GDYXXLXY domain-containing protein [Opitutus sp.]